MVATTGMIGDAARAIGGDAATVTTLMGPGVDPHLYRPSQGDLRVLREADLILYNGLGLEGRMGEILSRLADQTTVVRISDHVPEDRLRTVAGFSGQADPHLWMDPRIWREAVRGIHEALRAVAPEHAAMYDANATAYKQALDALDAEIREILSGISPDQRVLVSAHDAFGYFGDAYDFKVVALQGISTEAEFGLRDLERIVEVIVEHEVPALFLETSVSRRSIEALAEGARARGQEVILGGPIYSDALGAEGGPTGTYLGMMRHNAHTIAEALQ